MGERRGHFPVNTHRIEILFLFLNCYELLLPDFSMHCLYKLLSRTQSVITFLNLFYFHKVVDNKIYAQSIW